MQLRTWIGIISVLLLAGCGKEAPPAAGPARQIANSPEAHPGAPAKSGDNKPILNVDAGQAAAMHVTRAKDIQALKSDMTQIAQYYIQYETENNRAPANWQEFKTYMGNEAAKFAKEVESDKVVINYGIKPSSNTILAYEKNPDLNGVQVVVFGDKHVGSLTPAQLKQGLQAK